MFGGLFGKGKENGGAPPAERGRVVEVGWLLSQENAGFIWEAPKKFVRDEPGSAHAKSVRYCPAVLDHEARMYEIPCPIDAEIAFRMDEKGEPRLVNAAGDQSAIRSKHLGQMVMLVARKEWRNENRPVVQIITPYHFIADEPVYMTQLPPFAHYRSPQWPGVLIGGRLPIDVWPRQMMWAFEWYEPKQNLVLKRGEPWFYVRFETNDPSRPIRLIEAEMTDELKEYMKGMAGVTNYVNRTYSLFSTARERRPAKLLVPKKRS
jgi:hypothetical protein